MGACNCQWNKVIGQFQGAQPLPAATTAWGSRALLTGAATLEVSPAIGGKHITAPKSTVTRHSGQRRARLQAFDGLSGRPFFTPPGEARAVPVHQGRPCAPGLSRDERTRSLAPRRDWWSHLVRGLLLVADNHACAHQL